MDRELAAAFYDLWRQATLLSAEVVDLHRVWDGEAQIGLNRQSSGVPSKNNCTCMVDKPAATYLQLIPRANP